MEEVTCEEHVDPRVAAAVEAGQEHGNDEGRSCGVGREEKRTGGHFGAIPDLPDSAMAAPATTMPGLDHNQPLTGSQDKVPTTHAMSLTHILVQGSLPDLTRAQLGPESYLTLVLYSSSPGTEGLCPSQVLYASQPLASSSITQQTLDNVCPDAWTTITAGAAGAVGRKEMSAFICTAQPVAITTSNGQTSLGCFGHFIFTQNKENFHPA